MKFTAEQIEKAMIEYHKRYVEAPSDFYDYTGDYAEDGRLAAAYLVRIMLEQEAINGTN